MSHAIPGYVLSLHVPPRRSAPSRMVKSWMPACFKRIAIPIPANPAPMMSTWSVSRDSAGAEPPEGRVAALGRRGWGRTACNAMLER